MVFVTRTLPNLYTSHLFIVNALVMAPLNPTCTTAVVHKTVFPASNLVSYLSSHHSLGQGIFWNYKSHHVTSLLKTFWWLLIALRVKSKLLPVAPAAPITWPLQPPHPHWPPSSDSLFTLSAPAMTPFSLFCTHSQLFPASGTLCWPFPLMGTWFSQTLQGWLSLFLQVSAKMSPSQCCHCATPTKAQFLHTHSPSILCMACTTHHFSSSSLVCLSLPLWYKRTRAEIRLSCSPLCRQLPTWCLHTVGTQ